MTKTFYIATALVTVVLAGCATAPQNIAPTYVSEMNFQHLNCQQLYGERQRTMQGLGTAYRAQSKARTNDTIGVMLIGVPVSTSTGSNQNAHVANLKGTIDALNNVGRRKGCF